MTNDPDAVSNTGYSVTSVPGGQTQVKEKVVSLFVPKIMEEPVLIPMSTDQKILKDVIDRLDKFNQEFINSFNLKTLTYLHVIRLPVEICLALLYHHETMSIYVTYDGTNFDIISGISAPIIAFVCFKKDRIQKKILLIWNIVCMLLLINVVVTAILSTPSPLQQLAFDQPNTAILYFPFSLLPTMIVPIVLFAHLVAIKKITK